MNFSCKVIRGSQEEQAKPEQRENGIAGETIGARYSAPLARRGSPGEGGKRESVMNIEGKIKDDQLKRG
jgi:hypothetical protein